MEATTKNLEEKFAKHLFQHEPKLDVWRTCNKIRAAVFRSNINLWNCFKECDPSKNTLIAESSFINNLTTHLKDSIGLSDQEIIELSDYFRVQDGRIAFAQFCNVIHDNERHPSDNSDLVSGLEWEDPLQKNRLSIWENRRLNVLLTKIAQSVRLRDVVFSPYFQDYELVSENSGTVTLAHFARILNFQKIYVSGEEFQLLTKRYIKDSYTINYVAFVKDIEDIVRYLDSHRIIDFSEDFVENFPGKVITANLPKLPRPEIGIVDMCDIYKTKSSFHPVLSKKKPSKELEEVINRIKRHVLENRIRVREYFEDSDPLRSGYITKSRFIRGLDILGISKLGRLYLSADEIEKLCSEYRDELDPNRVNWKSFEIDIEEVVVTASLDKRPYLIVESPQKEIIELPRNGLEDWNTQEPKVRETCEDTLYEIKSKIIKRQLNLEPCFKDLDDLRSGHVTNSQMRRVLSQNGILLSNDEFFALIKRYSDDKGFNYNWFLKEADPQEYLTVDPKFEKRRVPPVKSNQNDTGVIIHRNKQKCRVQVLAKIKGFVAKHRVNLYDFLKDYDKHNKLCILESDFRRGLNLAGLRLECMEMNMICEAFRSPLRNNTVDYKRFCDVIEEVFCQSGLERAPLIVPLQHIPSDDNSQNFLNFDERQIASAALKKLSKQADQISNVRCLFEDFDKGNASALTGTVTQNQFLRVLTTRRLNDLLSSREYEVICKCFGIKKGLATEFNYRSFLHTLKLLFANRQQHPF